MSFLLNWLESLSKEINVTANCSRKILSQSTCLICIEQCKHKAVTITPNGVTIDSLRCTMCGECVAACPLSALEGIGPQRTFDKDGLLYAELSPPSVKELLIYKKRGIKSIILQDNSLNQFWVQAIEKANYLLERLEEQPITVNHSVPVERISRREFFNSIQFEGKQLAKGLAPASWKLTAQVWDVRNYYPGFEFFSAEIDQNRCLLCQACFSVCPEKVFRLTETALEINSEHCFNCRLCIDICTEQAIKIIPNIQRKKNRLIDYHSNVCQNCGQTFYSFQTHALQCHICKNRDIDWLSPY